MTVGIGQGIAGRGKEREARGKSATDQGMFLHQLGGDVSNWAIRFGLGDVQHEEMAGATFAWDVGCEACRGPVVLRWMKKGRKDRSASGVSWWTVGESQAGADCMQESW